MDSVNDTAKVISAGGVVIFPTDTVFGIGCKIGDDKAVSRLYEIKKREEGKPTLVLVKDIEQARTYGLFEGTALNLTREFWPGPLTLVVKAKKPTPALIRGKGDTIGIRQPKFKFLEGLLAKLDHPLLAPSANFAGAKTPVSFEQIDKKLLNLVDYVVKSSCGGEKPSTVVDVSGSFLKIIRKGPISQSKIMSVIKQGEYNG